MAKQLSWLPPRPAQRAVVAQPEVRPSWDTWVRIGKGSSIPAAWRDTTMHMQLAALCHAAIKKQRLQNWIGQSKLSKLVQPNMVVGPFMSAAGPHETPAQSGWDSWLQRGKAQPADLPHLLTCRMRSASPAC